MLADIFNCVLAWLITYGVAMVCAWTDGPFGLCSAVRTWIQNRTKKQWIRHGIECPVCISFWAGVIVAPLLGGSVAMWLSSVGFTAVVVTLAPPND